MTPQKVKLTRVFSSDKDKNGKTFVTKTGKPFWKVAIQTDRTGDVWYSTMCFRQDAPEMGLKEGDEVTVILEKNGQWNNFKLPTKIDLLEIRVKDLEDKVAFLNSHMSGSDSPTEQAINIIRPTEYPDGPNPEDIPF